MESLAGSTKVSLEPKIPSETNSSYQKDGWLQVSRRLDWRFMLQTPDFESVAYLGPKKDPLLDALVLFSPALKEIQSFTVPGYDRQEFDLVVVKNPSIMALEQGAGLVKPGGHLYVEVSGWPKWFKSHLFLQYIHGFLKHDAKSPLWSPSRCRAAIQLLGLSMIQTYWHWPNFESCTKIIPLGGTDTAVIAFSFPESGILGLLKKALVMHLIPTGWVEANVPYFSIIARRNPA